MFDPLAVMLVIAANQTLLRYGINLEKTGPDDDGDQSDRGNGGSLSDETTSDRQTDDKDISEDSSQGGNTADDSVHLQQVGTTGEHSSSQQVDQHSAVDDAAIAMAEAAVQQKKEIAKLKRELKKKPKEVIKEVEKFIEVEKDDVDINLRAPKGIKALEKKLEKRLNKDGN